MKYRQRKREDKDIDIQEKTNVEKTNVY